MTAAATPPTTANSSIARMARLDGITFAKTLTFQSGEGIPSVLRLRRFAEQFMGVAP